MVGVPEMTPPELTDRPGGAPDRDQPVMVAVDEESVAVTVTLVMAVPAVDVWPAGVLTVTMLWMVQAKTVDPCEPGRIRGLDGCRIAARGGRRAGDDPGRRQAQPGGQ